MQSENEKLQDCSRKRKTIVCCVREGKKSFLKKEV